MRKTHNKQVRLAEVADRPRLLLKNAVAIIGNRVFLTSTDLYKKVNLTW